MLARTWRGVTSTADSDAYLVKEAAIAINDEPIDGPDEVTVYEHRPRAGGHVPAIAVLAHHDLAEVLHRVDQVVDVGSHVPQGFQDGQDVLVQVGHQLGEPVDRHAECLLGPVFGVSRGPGDSPDVISSSVHHEDVGVIAPTHGCRTRPKA